MGSQITEWLAGGDLRSDGLANEAANFVLLNPELIGELFLGLDDSDEVIRGRTADALEKVARSRPDLLIDRLDELISVAREDRVPMVGWHLAMIFGHLAGDGEAVESFTPVLLEMLQRQSVFIKSWAIVSLCIVGRLYPRWNHRILDQVSPLQTDPSIAIRSKVGKAIQLLTNPEAPFPKGWVKSTQIEVG
jgi:hypothetical protein